MTEPNGDETLLEAARRYDQDPEFHDTVRLGAELVRRYGDWDDPVALGVAIGFLLGSRHGSEM